MPDVIVPVAPRAHGRPEKPGAARRDVFARAGPQNDSRVAGGAVLTADNIFASPGGLRSDKDERLRIQGDIGEAEQNHGPLAVFGNNQMLLANPVTGRIRRFPVGPPGQEITGCVTTPDGRTMFVTVQHPAATTMADDIAASRTDSPWPDGGNAPPRPTTVVTTRNDGGVIGT